MSDPRPSERKLIVFTRYPEPGAAKTRLIPALGARGAAELHRRLTEAAVQQAGRLATSDGVDLEIHFAGGDLAAMSRWLGPDLVLRSQSGDDLGDRLAAAFTAGFAAGASAVVIMGSDCPGLDSAILRRAFAALTDHDIVLGPAADGGYTLIGLRRPAPELFRDIPWSSDQVLAATVARARDLRLLVALLPTLIDIDRPDDLVRVGPPWNGGWAPEADPAGGDDPTRSRIGE